MRLPDRIRRRDGQWKRWVVNVFVLAAVIITVFWLFLQNNIYQVRDQNRIYISNTALQTASRIDDVLESTEQSVATFAQLYSDTLEDNEPAPEVLEDIAENSMCDFVEYVNRAGFNVTAHVDVSDREYYQKGIAGETGIDVIYNSRGSGNTLVVFYAPLVYENETVGVLLAGYQKDHMSEILEENYFGENSASYLCESDGTVIARSETASEADNVRDIFTEELVSGEDRETFLNALKEQTSCVFSANGTDGETDACLAPLSSMDWCIVQTYPSSVTANRIHNINRVAVGTVLLLILAFSGYIFMILRIEHKRRKSLIKEKKEAESVVEGVNRLFARFIVVNLEDDSYVYLKDYSISPSSLERQGSYREFIKYFEQRIIETVGDTRLQDVLEPEFFCTHLNTETPILRYHFCVRRDTGVHWESGSFVCLARDAAGVPTRILFAIQDITELHEREEEKNQALRDAFHAAEAANHAKDDFLSRMSHDMRTPMNAIMGMAEIAEASADDPERVKDCADKIRISGEHLLSMINAMLDLSRIESGKICYCEQPFEVGKCVRQVTDYLRTQIEEKKLQLVFPGNEIRHEHVSGDKNLLQRMLTSVLENAVEYTPEGGTISLSMYEEDTFAAQMACYSFVCEDTGIGMTKELLERAFEPFVRAKDSRLHQGQGVGLGLAVAKQFARLMGGDIFAESTPGKGSRFTIKVQLKILQKDAKEPAAETAGKDAAEGCEKQERSFEGCRILLVEDNALNAEIAVELLSMLGAKTDTAENGQAAVERLLGTETCPYDLILMDIQMPVMNGYEAAQRIRAAGRADLARVPIVALSANAFRDDIDRALASGMNAHLAKPVSCKSLAETLKKWIG